MFTVEVPDVVNEDDADIANNDVHVHVFCFG